MSHAPSEVLRTRQLAVVYRRGTLWSHGASVQALHPVDLCIHTGEIVGVVGPSGCGKSTLARSLALREAPSQGSVEVLGVDAWKLSPRELRALRPKVQLVDQSPAAALDPRFTVARALSQPLRSGASQQGARPLEPQARKARVQELLQSVDLDPDLAPRPCQALSGGQKQRLVIARALAAEPRALVFDEPLAALDAHQHQRLLDLLRDLHQRHDLTYVWISHDLHTVADFTQRLLVLDRGRVVERGSSRQVWQAPEHAVSRALVDADRMLAETAHPTEGAP